MLSLVARAAEFAFYHLLLAAVDRVSHLPRYTTEPDALRLYRENIALKAQLEALARHLATISKKPRPSVRLRAAQVFAYLLTRGNEPFQRYFLSAPVITLQHWLARFRHLGRRVHDGGRPPVDARVVELVVTLKRENPAWGQRRIGEELRRLGIRVSEPTIARILAENGFPPRPSHKVSFARVRAAAKDALWALDYFAVRTAKGRWLQALLIIDVHTRELLELRVYPGWEVDSEWTSRAFNEVVARTKRTPMAVVHDHGGQFLGQFERQLRVQEIRQEVTPPHVPQMNCYAERAIGSVRRELLRHIRVPDADALQFFLDEYRRYANTERAHQGLDGRTPQEASNAVPEAELVDLITLRERRLERREYALGLLRGYSLVEGPGQRKAA